MTEDAVAARQAVLGPTAPGIEARVPATELFADGTELSGPE